MRRRGRRLRLFPTLITAKHSLWWRTHRPSQKAVDDGVAPTTVFPCLAAKKNRARRDSAHFVRSAIPPYVRKASERERFELSKDRRPLPVFPSSQHSYIGLEGTPLAALAPQDRLKSHIREFRRRKDSNPRWGCPHNGFQDRRIQPLCHASKTVRCIFEHLNVIFQQNPAKLKHGAKRSI